MSTYLKKAIKTPETDERETQEIVERILEDVRNNGEEAYIRHYGAKFKDWSQKLILTKEEIADIQSRVNSIIESDLPVTESFVPKATAERLYNAEKVPNTVYGNLRIIHIGDYDACPCIGEHVSFTGEIGAFRITSTTYSDGKLRIRFKLTRLSAAPR